MLKNILDSFKKFNSINLQINKTIANWIVGILIFSGIVIIIWNANWTFGDDIQFMCTTAIRNPIFHAFGNGRFFPLGSADYNILLAIPFGHTITAHLIWNSILFLICAIVIFNYLKKITNNDYLVSVICFVIMICSAAFMRVNMLTFFPENVICLLFSVFILCVWNGESRQLTKYYIYALMSAIYVTYVKEPVFGVFLIIAFTRLLFGFRYLSQKDKNFYYALITNSIIYLIVYFYLCFCTFPTQFYNEGRCFSRGMELFFKQLDFEPILIIVVILSIIRLYYVNKEANKNRLFFDSLLFAAVGYFFAFYILNLCDDYYVLPCVFLSIPSFAYWLHYFRRQKMLFIGCSFFLLLFAYRDSHVSVKTVENILRARRNDMTVVNYLCDRLREGKKIVNVVLDNADPRFSFVRDDNMNKWNFFITFVFNEIKIPIKQVNKLDSVDENTIVLFQTRGQSIEDLLSQAKMKNFFLHSQVADTKIYVSRATL